MIHTNFRDCLAKQIGEVSSYCIIVSRVRYVAEKYWQCWAACDIKSDLALGKFIVALNKSAGSIAISDGAWIIRRAVLSGDSLTRILRIETLFNALRLIPTTRMLSLETSRSMILAYIDGQEYRWQTPPTWFPSEKQIPIIHFENALFDLIEDAMVKKREEKVSGANAK